MQTESQKDQFNDQNSSDESDNNELEQDKQLLETLQFTLTMKNSQNIKKSNNNKILAKHIFIATHGHASIYLSCVFNQVGIEIANLNFSKKTQKFLASIYQHKQNAEVFAIVFNEHVKSFIDHDFPGFLEQHFEIELTTILESKNYIKLNNFQLETENNFMRVLQTTQLTKHNQKNICQQLEDCNNVEGLGAQILQHLEINRKIAEMFVIITQEYDLFIGDVKKFEILVEKYGNILKTGENLEKNYAENIKKYNKLNINNKFYL